MAPAIALTPTEEANKRSRKKKAVGHGLPAETVIDTLEDAEDYAAFEMAVTADYDAQTAVERELVLRLASEPEGRVRRPWITRSPKLRSAAVER